MRILLTAIGSLGDVFPYIGLARELHRHGHAVTIGTAAYFRPYVAAAGIDFAPLRPDYVAFRRQENAFREFALHRLTRDGPGVARFVEMFSGGIDVNYADVLALARKCDVMVTHQAHLAAVLAARKLGVPWVSTALSSMQLLSRHDPMEWEVLIGYAHLLARCPGLGRRLWALRVPVMRRTTAHWFGKLADLARREGVQIEGHPFFDWPFSPRGTAAMFSPLLASPKPDWPARTRITGCIPYVGATQCSLPDPVSRFLDAGTAPVVFMLGSWSAESAAFFVESADACRRLGRRGIIVAPGIDGLDFGPDVLVSGYLPVDALFARAAAIVHHGGVGTLQHAILAGKVMVVVPHALDQYPNAWQACRLGTASALSPTRYRGAAAAAALDAVMGKAALQQRAAVLAARMRQEDGAAQASAFIEAAAAGPA